MKSAGRITADLMKRIRAMNNLEYTDWLNESLALVKKMPKASELYFLEKQRKERRIDAIMKSIHSDGLEQWRKQHERR